jgi:hypothetical protein
MVKSRTFGQKLHPVTNSDAAAEAEAEAEAEAPPAAAAAAAAAAADQELEGDDSNVFLLMAPYIDMINHAQQNNCSFGIDPSNSRCDTYLARDTSLYLGNACGRAG